MRTLTAIALALATTAGVPAIAAAQSATPPQNAPAADTMQNDTTAPGSTMGTTMGSDTAAQKMLPPVITEQAPDQVLSDRYIGAKVVANASEGVEDVGKVSDLVLDADNKIVGVVVDIGGFLGVAAKPVGLSWASLSEQQADGELLLRTSLSRQELEEAPEFKTLQDQQVESDKKMIEQQEQAPATMPAQ